MKSILRAFCCLSLAVAGISAQDSGKLDFATGLSEFREIRQTVPKHLRRQAYELLEARRRAIAAIRTPEQLAQRRAYIRETIVRDLGGFPERTPLNARTVGTLDRGDYTIEKIVFESQPKFYVTANLYIPKRGTPPYPAVLYPLGHEAGAKAHDTWQQMLGSLAKKGFVALTWDPQGQGERVQLWDEDLGDSKAAASTTEHTIFGIQMLLAGDSLARYTIWDGIRALDYLLSRKEVDPKRVGCAGNSGGGTLTTYLSALDDRIKVAAPSCYTNSWRMMLDTIGPQDAEQNMPPFIARGLDYPDFIYGFAPKPFLVLSAIRDFFPISGARDTFDESKSIYERVGAADKIAMVEADDGHGYTKPRRLAAYNWLARWLKGAEDNEPEPEIQQATYRELQCTPTGQVVTSLGGETVFTLNQKRSREAIAKRQPGDLAATVRKLIGYTTVNGAARVRQYGTIERAGYRIEKLTYESEPGIVIPSLLYVPQGAGKRPAVVYVDGKGKAAADADAEQFVKAGMTVLSIDARDFGETRAVNESRSAWSRYFGDWESGMTALLIGKPLVGLRARDVSRAIDVLMARPDIDPTRVYCFGKGGGAPPALHTAVLDARIRGLVLEEMLVSYEAVASRRFHRNVFEQVVVGALRHYDLPLLAGSLAPRPVWVVNAVDPMGEQLAAGEVRKVYGAGAIQVRERRPEDRAAVFYQEFTVPVR
ncbi:MAG TPA: acetylxylan esterase [Bryobacteraceae bacterium]|nr:acetylxylan esterase [Bryobacteraceae bacterium]